MIWGVLGLLNGLYDNFITGHIHLQLNLVTLEKMVKLLVICDAIPPRV